MAKESKKKREDALVEALAKHDRDAFNKAVARLLKSFFPQLGTNEDMPGADTVDTLSELYDKAINGQLEAPGHRS